jgi:hypothetical protein
MIRGRKYRRLLGTSAALILLIAGGCMILTLPTTTRQGINYEVTRHRIPLYVKTIDFFQRHYQQQLLASSICEGRPSDVDCVLAIFDWTHRNIPRTPEGWTIVDDHVTNIVIRGHGMSDQIADVFATLSVYAGVPAFFKVLDDPAQPRHLVLAFAQIGGKWIPFDVEQHLVFRNRGGQLASVDELLVDPALIDEQAAGRLVGELPYSRYISAGQLAPFTVPDPLRATLHQPWPRLKYELRRMAGLQRE